MFYSRWGFDLTKELQLDSSGKANRMSCTATKATKYEIMLILSTTIFMVAVKSIFSPPLPPPNYRLPCPFLAFRGARAGGQAAVPLAAVFAGDDFAAAGFAAVVFGLGSTAGTVFV